MKKGKEIDEKWNKFLLKWDKIESKKEMKIINDAIKAYKNAVKADKKEEARWKKRMKYHLKKENRLLKEEIKSYEKMSKDEQEKAFKANSEARKERIAKRNKPYSSNYDLDIMKARIAFLRKQHEKYSKERLSSRNDEKICITAPAVSMINPLLLLERKLVPEKKPEEQGVKPALNPSTDPKKKPVIPEKKPIEKIVIDKKTEDQYKAFLRLEIFLKKGKSMDDIQIIYL